MARVLRSLEMRESGVIEDKDYSMGSDMTSASRFCMWHEIHSGKCFTAHSGWGSGNDVEMDCLLEHIEGMRVRMSQGHGLQSIPIDGLYPIYLSWHYHSTHYYFTP